STERPSWAASFHGKPILTNCSFGLQTTDTGELMAGVRVVRERRRSVDRRIPVLLGKSAYANDSFHETRFTFETPRHRRLDVTFRCYNDAVAFRYELPRDEARSVTIAEETTSSRVEGEPTAY